MEKVHKNCYVAKMQRHSSEACGLRGLEQVL